MNIQYVFNREKNYVGNLALIKRIENLKNVYYTVFDITLF